VFVNSSRLADWEENVPAKDSKRSKKFHQSVKCEFPNPDKQLKGERT